MLRFKTYASGSSGNLYTISDGKTTIMIDPGISWKKIQKALDFRTSEITACLLDHEHRDHSFAVEDVARAGIDVFLLPQTRKNLKLNGHRYHDLELKKTFQIGTIKIVSFPLQHDVPNCGFLFQDQDGDKALFIVDTGYCRYRFKGLNIIALEANYSKKTMAQGISPVYRQRLYKSHLSLENAIKLLQANDLSRVREVHLIHMSKMNSNPEFFKSEVQKATGKPVYIGGY